WQVGQLQETVDADSEVPRCFSERRVVRDRNKRGRVRDRAEERVEKQEKEVIEAPETLKKDRAALARHGGTPGKLEQRIDDPGVPKPGQRWGAAVAFLEQAAKCLRDRGADPKLQEALRRANNRKK
ncbi:unnamed protein product, partial [Prorocentrum cordatum]